MTSLIFRAAAPIIMLLLIVFSIYALLRGHHEPGGGFIGGLLIAAAFALHVLAHDVPSTRRLLAVDPHTLVGGGLLLAAGAGVMGMMLDGVFLKAVWGHLTLPGFGEVELGSTLLFDIGVYAVVMGVVLMIIFTAAETVE
jgi:multicomponent Na+:H+ antiporter subunit B